MRPKISKEAIRRSAERSTRESAALEGRIIPDGYVRSSVIEKFLRSRMSVPMKLVHPETTDEDLDCIQYGDSSENWRFVDKQWMGNTRWYSHHLHVYYHVSDPEVFWGWNVEAGLTEMQEPYEPISGPVQVYPIEVVKREWKVRK